MTNFRSLHPTGSTQKTQYSPSKSEGSNWMMTFVDLLSLLLAFFILSYSMATIPKNSWQEISDTMSRTFHGNRVIKDPSSSTLLDAATVLDKKALNIGYLKTILNDKLKRYPALKDTIHITRKSGHLELSLPSHTMFEANSETLSMNASTLLLQLSEVLKQINNRIEILAYAHTGVINGSNFQSVWELMLARATSIAHELKFYGITKRMDAMAQVVSDAQRNKERNLEKNQTPGRSGRLVIAVYPEQGESL